MKLLENSIVNIDCLLGLSYISDNSIDMVLTSPPYDNLRNYHKNISETWNEEWFGRRCFKSYLEC